MRNLKEIIIHCTATPPHFMDGKKTSQKVEEIKRWHVEERGWSDIGYHFLIDRDGTVARGRPLERAGAHVKGKNTGSIGVSLFGGKSSSARDNFEDNFTAEQEEALRGLLGQLQADYPSIKKISGHNEYAAKACPGFHVGKWLNDPWPVNNTHVEIAIPQEPKATAVPQEVIDLIEEASGESSKTDLFNKLQENGSLFAAAFTAATAFIQDLSAEKLLIVGGVVVACVAVYSVSSYTRRSRGRKSQKALAAKMALRVEP